MFINFCKNHKQIKIIISKIYTTHFSIYSLNKTNYRPCSQTFLNPFISSWLDLSPWLLNSFCFSLGWLRSLLIFSLHVWYAWICLNSLSVHPYYLWWIFCVYIGVFWWGFRSSLDFFQVRSSPSMAISYDAYEH